MILRFRVFLKNASYYRVKNWLFHRQGGQGSITEVVGHWTYYKPKPDTSLSRAREALEALRTPISLNEIVVKYRLGAYMSDFDARNAVIDYGLGKRDPDPSVKKEVK